MKKIFLSIFILVGVCAFAQVPVEIQTKAQNVTTQYQSVSGVNATDALAVKNLLISYFTYRSNGTPITPSMLSQVNNIITVAESGSAGPLTATNIKETVNGALSVTDPTFNRTSGSAAFDIGCPTQGTLSSIGSNVYYDVIEFTVTQAGVFDIEVTDFLSSMGVDSYLELYCSFNPLNARENLIIANDDEGSDLLSRLQDITLPPGTYYLVMTAFDNGETGNYTIQFRSDNGSLVLGSNPVPVSIWWIVSLFALLATSIVVKKMWF
jgi:hypothetical protein